MRLFCLLTCVILAFVSCDKEDPRDFQVSVDNTLFQIAKPLAEVKDPQLDEVSGMVVSRKNPGHLWVHNDSGDEARLYLINLQAEVVLIVTLEGVEAIDWEDLTWREHNGESQLIIGDIGDNKALRDFITLHIIEEPLYESSSVLSISKDKIKSIDIQYEEGPRDAESIAYDHKNENIVLVTKREESVMVYEFELGDQGNMVIESGGTINLRNFTSADINISGQLLLKNYNSIFYWSSNDDFLEKNPVRVPYLIEPQGEAIAWDSAGGFYVLSEHNIDEKQILYYYEPKD